MENAGQRMLDISPDAETPEHLFDFLLEKFLDSALLLECWTLLSFCWRECWTSLCSLDGECWTENVGHLPVPLMEKMLDISMISCWRQCWTLFVLLLKRIRNICLSTWWIEFCTSPCPPPGKNVGHPSALFTERILNILCSLAGQNTWCLFIQLRGLFAFWQGQPRPYQGMKLLCRSTFRNVKSV